MTNLDQTNYKPDQQEGNQQFIQSHLGDYQTVVDAALDEIGDQKIVKRIWEHDHTVWQPDPTELTNRLGWLHSPENMPETIERIMSLVDAVRADGYKRVLLLGMGGSSLAPEVFQKVFGKPVGADNDFLELAILDSTDPDILRERASKLDLSKTLFVVATKSGGTVETMSAFKYFYNQVIDAVGLETAGDHFIAITDPGSGLVDIAKQHRFRETFLNDPNIGGRYATLSFFGLVPAGLVGVDLPLLLERAQIMAHNATSHPVNEENVGARLGVIMGELAKTGRDKVTIIVSPAIVSFGDWVEQLIAESTGKDGKGILPVVGEELGTPEVYADDRLFVHLRLEGDDDVNAANDAALARLTEAGHPVVVMMLKDRYDLGQHFFLWEVATAIAGARLGIHPFDQPNVEAAKILARQMVAEYMEKGKLPAGQSALLTSEALHQFLTQASSGDYVAIHAYVPPSDATDEALNALRLSLRDRLKVATTIGYGPRFLHSTGQLHKGDGGNGIFIQFTSEAIQDVPIPDETGKADSTMSFDILKNAQALGDAQALKDAGRRVIRFEMGQNVAESIRSLINSIE